MMYSKQGDQIVMINGDVLMVNSQHYNLPKRIQKRKGHSLVQVNGKLYVDCYEFKNGEFKWSILAIFHMIF